jgi:hypothetical protein
MVLITLFNDTDLYYYKENFKTITQDVFKGLIKQKIYVAELKHIPGFMFDDVNLITD